MFSDDDVAKCVAAAISRGVRDVPLGVVEATMNATAELLAASGGAMTAEELREALAKIDALPMPKDWGRDYTADVADQLAALGARNAVLEKQVAHWKGCAEGNENAWRLADGRADAMQDERDAAHQHVSDLEKSLENARKERDEWLQKWRTERDEALAMWNEAVGAREKAERERDEAVRLLDVQKVADGSTTQEVQELVKRLEAIVERVHPEVVRLLSEHDTTHRFHWSVRCITCAPRNARERKMAGSNH